MKRLVLSVLLTFALPGAHLGAQPPGPPEHGVQLSTLDTAVKPCEDFFEYASGGWLKANHIPAQYPSWDASWEVYERNMALLKTIMEGAARDTSSPKGSARRLAGDFFASGMDERSIETAGIGPLASRIQHIQGVSSPRDLATELGRLHREGIDAGFAFGVGIDDKASDRTIAKLEQSGLGLPDRDYYTKDDAQSKLIRAQYLQHVVRMFQLMGDPASQAAMNAQVVMTMETRLAKASMTAVEKRDPQSVYHKMTREQIVKEAPGFDWAAYFTAVGLPPAETALVVRQPSFLREFALMTQTLPPARWRAYLRWHLIHGTARYLSAPFVMETFGFYSKTLSGVEELRPRWQRVLSATEGAMGEAVGQLYVEKAFSPEAKGKALDLVKNLQAALRERMIHLDWMTEATKKKALAKLGTFIIKIGYPDRWRDYSTLEITRGPYVLNALAANAFESRRNLAKLGKPVDRTEWLMNAEEVNAYYEPLTNEICFPAGILQPPFFDPQADDASNYGATGATIGHEMTHGFDDEGSQYDASGNLRDWWTPQDRRAYAERQAIMVKQYDAYMALPDQAINGKLTLGENIADLGGLTIAFAALEHVLADKPAVETPGGFTPQQRFFLAYAQSWRTLQRPEALRVQLNTDPHSPPRFRVLGPLADLPEFQKAFGCAEGSPMVRPPAQRPAIW